MKEVSMELDGYLEYFAFAFVGEPGVRDVGADEDEFQVIDLFYAVSEDTFDPAGVFDEVEFVLFMIMHGEVKLCFISGKHREAIGFR